MFVPLGVTLKTIIPKKDGQKIEVRKRKKVVPRKEGRKEKKGFTGT